MSRKYKYKVLVKKFVYVETDSAGEEFAKKEVESRPPKSNYFGFDPKAGGFEVYTDGECTVESVVTVNQEQIGKKVEELRHDLEKSGDEIDSMLKELGIE